jgi:DNA-binding MarR family transcriptional regulator
LVARLENLLGAFALALTDRLLGAGPASPGSVSERAALVTLHAHADRPVSWLGQVLGLTSSGVTRLVDRLVAGGWVTRAPGRDARSRQLTLSAAGRDQARAVLRARDEAMAGAVRGLSEADRAELERLLGLVVRRLAADVSEALRVCRLCDRGACASGGFGCPLVDPDGRTGRDD